MDPVTFAVIALVVSTALSAVVTKPFRWAERAQDAAVGAGHGVRQGWTSARDRTRASRPVRGGRVPTDTGQGTPPRGGHVPTDTRQGQGHGTGTWGGHVPGGQGDTGQGTWDTTRRPHAPTDDMRDRAATRVHRTGWGGYRTGWGAGVLGVAVAEAARHGVRGAREAWRHGRTVTPTPDAETPADPSPDATPAPGETAGPPEGFTNIRDYLAHVMRRQTAPPEPAAADNPDASAADCGCGPAGICRTHGCGMCGTAAGTCCKCCLCDATEPTSPETAPTPEENPVTTDTATSTGDTAGSDQTHTSVQQQSTADATSLTDGGGLQQHLQQVHGYIEEEMARMQRLRDQAMAVAEDGGTFGGKVRQRATEQAGAADAAMKVLVSLMETVSAATRTVASVAEGAAGLAQTAGAVV